MTKAFESIVKMNIIPEVTILNFLNFALEEAEQDYFQNGNQSAIVQYFKGLKIENFDFVSEAINIFTRDNETNQKLQVYIGFNLQRTEASPAIHILLPNEQSGRYDSLGTQAVGMGMGFQTVEDNAIYSTGRAYKGRSFTCDYNLMITAMSSTQVILIYHFVRALLIGMKQELEASGLLNIVFAGSDINLMDEFVPPHVFSRMIRMTFDYSVSAPSTQLETFYKKLCVKIKSVL